jgi:hypothetical protein
VTERLPNAAEPGPAPDLAYDLAHEVTFPAEADRRRTEPVQVTTETDHDGGDYGYDLAHDIPRG